MGGLNQSLFLRELKLAVKLGVSAEERAIPQEVRVSAELRFVVALPALGTDLLSDTFCYGEICKALRACAEGPEFALVEKLGQVLFSTLKIAVGDAALVSISLLKVAPPVPGLLGGVVFRIGEFS